MYSNEHLTPMQPMRGRSDTADEASLDHPWLRDRHPSAGSHMPWLWVVTILMLGPLYDEAVVMSRRHRRE
jgi:hypothetical protein